MNTIKGMIEDLNNKNTHICGCTTAGELIIALERLQMLEEQQPCEDCVSRQALIDKATSWDAHFADSERAVSLTDIMSLPSVTSTRTKAKWIEVDDVITTCSNCGKSILTAQNWFLFCPFCGADMENGED